MGAPACRADGSAAGLFLTTAQSSVALGVAAIGDAFFSRLGVPPTAADYVAALADALSCNLALLAATFLLALLLPMAGRRSARPAAVFDLTRGWPATDPNSQTLDILHACKTLYGDS